MRRRLAIATLTTLLPLLAAPVAAQQPATGRIVGRILDAAGGQGLPDVQIQVVGTPTGTISGIDGKYTLAGVKAGTVTLVIKRIGYAQKTVTGIFLDAGKTLEQNVSLTAATVMLSAVSVTADAEKGTVTEALDLQKVSVNVVNAITAEQIGKSPDGDAAQTLQRVSGVTVQDGKYVQARGLGERYTTASLNGARLPSPEPERKVVPLDLFPSGLLQSVTTIKTFTPDLPGDFSGAQVDIKTREFPAERQTSYSLTIGANDRVLGKSLPMAPRVAGDMIGVTSSVRNIPRVIARTSFQSAIPQETYNAMVLAQRNVWTALQGSGAPNLSTGISVGGSQILGKRIGYLVSTSYGMSDEVRADDRYAVGNAGANGSVVPLTELAGITGRRSVQWGGLANISSLLGTSSRLTFTATTTRSADSEARIDRGFDENLSDSIARTTLRYVERGIATTNVKGEHQWGTRQRTEWTAAYGYTTRREPDRSDVVYSRNSSGQYQLLGSLDGARRLWFDLDEQNTLAEANHQILFGGAAARNSVKIGGYVRRTTRDADAPMYAFLTRAGSDVTALPAEQIFGAAQACATCSLLNVQPIGQAGSYDASDNTAAGFGMLEFGLGEKVRVVTGGRYEHAFIRVNSSTQAGFAARARLENGDLLPALIVNTKLSNSQNLRFAATQTVSRPEYRELAPVTFRDVLGGVSVTGNDKLRRTLIANFDARWELYPTAAEIVSIGAFAKVFDSPIERVEQATSGAYQATFQNAKSGTSFGVELEVRKDLDMLGRLFYGLTGFANVTVMQSRINLNPVQAQTVTDTERQMVGQAPYVLNTGVTWTNRSGATSATLLYNVVGERITAAGVKPLPNIVERPRHVVDAALRFPLFGNVTGRLDGKNLLDARYQFMQGGLEREGYSAGRGLSLGLNWKP
ncbi:MAG: TonB-dependent receptor [Gemmatimonadota bacterium]|nr:TonB-dependent receptor [Gemmatimonadota bacterium]